MEIVYFIAFAALQYPWNLFPFVERTNSYKTAGDGVPPHKTAGDGVPPHSLSPTEPQSAVQ